MDECRRIHKGMACITTMNMFAGVSELMLIGMSAAPMNATSADISGEKGRYPRHHRKVMRNTQ